MNVIRYFLSAVVVLISGAVAADEPMMVSVQRLSLNVAQDMARAAVAACEAKGIQIGVTVVDRNGIAQVVPRDTLAPPVVLEVSAGKARAAAMFNANTASLSRIADSALGNVPGLVLLAGAVPIQVGGKLLGAIGVSGAPSGETDEACARAHFQ